MQEITALFWDVGGVLLTNGWDTTSRRQAAEKFGLDWDDFQERHELVSAEFEKGRVTLDEYFECTIFYKPRDFSKQGFREFMFSRSEPCRECLEIVVKLAESNRFFMATLNNESRELNLHRIRTFHLDECFTAFFSSCFLGVKKPQREIYQAALEITQKKPEECLFVDDRALNLEAARQFGIQTIHFQGAEQLRRQLAERHILVSDGAAPATGR